MIQKKSFVNVIKRALQSGTFNYVGQEADQIPPQLFKLDQLNLQGQNWWDCVPITKMDFSNNNISAIPQAITMFVDLQLFRMKNNQLKSLPACFNKFQTLKSLDLSKNKLTSVPNQISKCFALVQLNLSENSLVSLPNLHEIRTLQHLIINDNKLKSLPLLGQGLRKIEASSNCIREVSIANFKLCTKLQNLSMNKNGLEVIQKGTFSQTKSLIMIQLKENKLTTFSEVPQSDKLDTIALSFNRLTQFQSFERCPNLTVLILNDNKLKKLSPNIIKLKQLKTLDISNNDLPNLPSELGFINSLVRLQIQGNPLTSIRQNIRMSGTNQLKSYLRDKMDPAQKQALEKNIIPQNSYTPHQQWNKLIQQFCMNGELVLKGMKLQNLHSLVFQKDLKVLNVSDNKLTQIPQEIQRLKSLKALYLNKNDLSKLPYRLATLSALESIEAQHNKLTDFIPYQKPFFSSLHYLDLSTNKITEIPPSILKIPKLRTLLLSYNKISSIQILWNEQCLHNLQILDVSSNQISDISDLVFCKQSLNYLNLQNNNLSKLPTVLGFMKLLGLKIDGNPLKLIKRQVIEKGTVAIMQFLRNKHSGQIPIRKESKNTYQQKVQEPEVYQQFNHPQINKRLKQEPVTKAPIFEQKNLSKALIVEPKAEQDEKEKKMLLASIQKQLKVLQQQLQNGMGLNNWQRTEKKKKMQSLMIQRNKLLKQ